MGEVSSAKLSDVVLKTYKVNELNFVNKLENGTQVKFKNKFAYNVKYSNNNICIGEMTVEMFDGDAPEKFGVKLVLDGIFEFNPSLKKETVHVLSFKQLFPFAKSIVSSVSVNAGVPPILIPSFDIESQSIYKIEKNI